MVLICSDIQGLRIDVFLKLYYSLHPQISPPTTGNIDETTLFRKSYLLYDKTVELGMADV